MTYFHLLQARLFDSCSKSVCISMVSRFFGISPRNNVGLHRKML